ncbi:translation initiation factor IF-2 subunit gamma [Candidatus Woesearchaeota archaeon]|nr:translation initiation factor IF-2 subunit gamma [Candidatus Woesearchaeota archaeon]MBW3018549.1 translation initiation factor IF-2 subunit gamma [Candidatus Woesearchaeota archaeon]
MPIQPSVNIGLVGHVDHGKTTLTEKLSGKWTDQHSEELKRGITIRLGYADTTFYKCDKCNKYVARPKCPCGGEVTPIRKVSFVDAPGHETLMATMLCGSTIMDGALLLVAANEDCPQPQTREHLMALQIAGLKNVVIVQNKIDLVSEEQALNNFKQLKKFLKGTDYENSPVIPISALHNVNVDKVIEAIENVIVTPDRDPNADPLMFVARSFDINKPGSDPVNLKGGILGGSLKQGTFNVNDTIEIRPGRKMMKANKIVCEPIQTTAVGLMTGGQPVEEIGPGGSVAIMTLLDPSIVGADSLAGSVVGYPGKLPDIWYDLKIEANLLDRVVGAKDDLVVKPLAEKEVLMLNVNSAATVGMITDLHKNTATIKLKLPVCAEIGSKVTISRNLGNRWRLIGYGIIK